MTFAACRRRCHPPTTRWARGWRWRNSRRWSRRDRHTPARRSRRGDVLAGRERPRRDRQSQTHRGGERLAMLAMEVTAIGGPEVLRAVERARPIAGPGQVVIAIKAIGVNFVDLQHRAGAPVSDHSDAFHPRDRSVRRGRLGRRRRGANSRSATASRLPGRCRAPMRSTRRSTPAWSCPCPTRWCHRRGGDPDAGADSPLSHP